MNGRKDILTTNTMALDGHGDAELILERKNHGKLNYLISNFTPSL